MGAARDIRSNLSTDLIYYDALLATETSESAILDTTYYDGGIMLSFAAVIHNGGSCSLTNLLHSDDPSMAGAVGIPPSHIIGSGSSIGFTSVTAPGDPMLSLGFVGVKRYIQFVMGWFTAAGGSIAVMANKVSDYIPVVGS